jgi:hypothetical protein
MGEWWESKESMRAEIDRRLQLALDIAREIDDAIEDAILDYRLGADHV